MEQAGHTHLKMKIRQIKTGVQASLFYDTQIPCNECTHTHTYIHTRTHRHPLSGQGRTCQEGGMVSAHQTGASSLWEETISDSPNQPQRRLGHAHIPERRMVDMQGAVRHKLRGFRFGLQHHTSS